MSGSLGQTVAHLAFEDGAPVLRVAATAVTGDGNDVELYAGDRCLAVAPLRGGRQQEGEELSARFEDFDPPMLEFPANLRAVMVRSGEELGTGLVARDANALLAALGLPDIRLQLAGIGPDRLDFEIQLGRLTAYPRSFRLLLDGRETSEALSVQRHGAPGWQDLTLAIPAPLSNGTHVELFDIATGSQVFTIAATWMNLVWPVVLKEQMLERQLEQCRKDILSLNARLTRVLDLDRDRLLLERLDLFYFLLNQRIDRLAHDPSPAVQPEPADSPPAPGPLQVLPRALEGVGYYGLEGDGAREWRWFGPRVLLAFRQLGAQPTRVVLKFFRFAHGVTVPEVRVSVNGTAVTAGLSNPEPNRHLLDIPVLRSMWRPDQTLIVELQFGDQESSENDRRQLSAVFSSATLFLDVAKAP
jgi:hypothetical protein